MATSPPTKAIWQNAASRPMRLPAVLVASLLFAGCLGAADTTGPTANLTSTALTGNGTAAGSTTAFVVDDGEGATTIHPYKVPGGSPRAPESRSFTGTFAAQDCGPGGTGFLTGNPWRNHDFTDLFRAGDVVDLHVELRWTNTETSHGDIHLFVNTPGSGYFNSTGTDALRGEIVQAWHTQLLWTGEDGVTAGAGPACFFGVVAAPIEYTLDVHAAYAANVIAAQTPFLVNVPEGATHLHLTGLPTGDLPVTAHWRVFAPDDSLVGEFALNSNEASDAAALPSSGAYVVLVDHVENGFVALGADAPLVDDSMTALAYGFNAVEIYRSDTGGPVDATVPFTLPRVPLTLFVWADAAAEEPAGAARALTFSVEGPRGLVLEWAQGGWAATNVADMQIWQPLPTPGWQDITYDHHALAVGDHVANVNAENFRGSLTFFWVSYLRPGEDGLTSPGVGAAP